MARIELQAIITAKNEATKVLKGFAGSLEKISRQAKIAGTALTGFGIALGAKAISSAANFEAALSDINTLFDDNGEAVAVLSDGIKDLLKITPKSADDLGAAAYQIVSAGITDTALALEVLKSSTDLAVAGLATTEEATNLLTSAINTFGSEGKTAQEISDILFKTVKAGKTTISELAQGFGSVAPIIQSAGIQLADFQAATAALTTTGLPATQAQNSLRGSITALIKPTGDMEKIFEKLGVKTGRELIATSENLGDVFNKIKTAAEENNISLANAFGRVEALGAVISLTGATSDSYVNTLAGMTDGINKLDDAVKKQNATASAQFEIMKNNLNVAFIELGNKLLPVIVPLVQKLANLFSKMNPTVLKAALVFSLVVGPLLLLVGFLPALIAGFAALAPVIGAVGAVLAFLISPIGLIIAAIAALAFGIFLIIKNWDFLKQKTLEIWGAIKDFMIGVFESISSFISAQMTKIASVFTAGWDFIKNIFETIFSAITGIVKFQINFIVGLVELALNKMGTSISEVMEFIRNIITTVWEGISTFFSAIWLTISQIFTENLEAIKVAWQIVWDIIVQFITKRFLIIRNKVREGMDFVAKIITSAKEALLAAWNAVFQPIKDATDTIFDGIKNKIQAVLDFITGAIDRIKSAFTRIKGIAGGAISGIVGTGAEITGLARGGIVTKPTFAMIGEAGPEAVIPLNKAGGFGGTSIFITGTFLSDTAAEEVGDMIIQRLKQNINID